MVAKPFPQLFNDNDFLRFIIGDSEDYLKYTKSRTHEITNPREELVQAIGVEVSTFKHRT